MVKIPFGVISHIPITTNPPFYPQTHTSQPTIVLQILPNNTNQKPPPWPHPLPLTAPGVIGRTTIRISQLLSMSPWATVGVRSVGSAAVASAAFAAGVGGVTIPGGVQRGTWCRQLCGGGSHGPWRGGHRRKGVRHDGRRPSSNASAGPRDHCAERWRSLRLLAGCQ